jgi:hypothetical protein
MVPENCFATGQNFSCGLSIKPILPSFWSDPASFGTVFVKSSQFCNKSGKIERDSISDPSNLRVTEIATGLQGVYDTAALMYSTASK